MLQSFGAGQQRRIDHGGPKRLANWSHRSPHRLQESGAGILHEVPAIGDLHGLRCRPGSGLTIATAAVAR
jgi:hypothetical protein